MTNIIVLTVRIFSSLQNKIRQYVYLSISMDITIISYLVLYLQRTQKWVTDVLLDENRNHVASQTTPLILDINCPMGQHFKKIIIFRFASPTPSYLQKALSSRPCLQTSIARRIYSMFRSIWSDQAKLELKVILIIAI